MDLGHHGIDQSFEAFTSAIQKYTINPSEVAVHTHVCPDLNVVTDKRSWSHAEAQYQQNQSAYGGL